MNEGWQTVYWSIDVLSERRWCAQEITTFTDCVNCLIAFTNNPHSLDVALNAIAFLRFCAMKLADGTIGEWHASSREMFLRLKGFMFLGPWNENVQNTLLCCCVSHFN